MIGDYKGSELVLRHEGLVAQCGEPQNGVYLTL
jgi:hypothetical protein